MEKHPDYASLGLKALRRAAAKVAEDAIRKNYKIPYWENGKIVYKIPDMPTEFSSHDSVAERQEL
jgi:hypothetical protein